MNLSFSIKQHCVDALNKAFPGQNWDPETSIEITKATQEQYGHYQCNSPMRLGKLLNMPPKTVAEKLTAQLKKVPLFEKVEIAGPGFINFSLKPEILAEIIQAQLQDPRLGVPQVPPLTVVIDYSSPNIAKEMHVGHLRTTIIGDCLARILRFLGHRVLPVNHVGDWGTQFGMLIAHLKTLFPEMTADSFPVVDASHLVKWYRESKTRFDTEPTFKKQAQEEVVALQSGNPTSLLFWEKICEISRKEYQAIYDLLEVNLLERGESFYNPMLPDILKRLDAQGLLKNSEGARCMYLEGFNNREGEPLPLILQKSDGGYNYATTDLAALYYRANVEKANWIIYVVDAGQTQHFQMIFKAGEIAKFFDPEHCRVTHVAYGLVLGADGKKIKTRSGESEKLMDLLQTAIDKAAVLLRERYQDMEEKDLKAAANILGINAIKYSDLSCHRNSDYVFSYDKMLRFEGNTAAFLLYALVRIKSIQRKVKTSSDKASNIVLKDPTEIALGLLICQFPEVLQQTEKELVPSYLCEYLYRLAEKFHLFFHNCRVEGVPEQASRLLLCEAVARVLETSFSLLGLKPLERM